VVEAQPGLPSTSCINGIERLTGENVAIDPKGLFGPLSNPTGPPPESRSPAAGHDHGAPEKDRLASTIESPNTPAAPEKQDCICEHCGTAFAGRKGNGFLLNRGRLGWEAFDANERPIGVFEDQAAAAAAIAEPAS
jgi:hypothetical protein